MKRIIVITSCASLLVGAAVAGGARAPSESSEPTWPLAAKLLGKNEISPTGKRNAGDRDGRGHASVSGRGTRICVALAYKDLGTITGAHIHRGRANQNGPIVVPLATPTNGALGASASCHTVAASLSKAIVRNPSGFYVNIHTTAFPNGAIRGQLKRA